MEQTKKGTQFSDEPIEAHRETSGLSVRQCLVIKRFVTSRLKGMGRPLDYLIKQASQELWDCLSNPGAFPGCIKDIRDLFAKYMVNAGTLTALEEATLQKASQELWDCLSYPESKFFPGCSMDIRNLFAKHMMGAAFAVREEACLRKLSQELWNDLSNPEGILFPGCSMDIQDLFARHMMNAGNLVALDRPSLKTIIASGRCSVRRERMVLKVSLESTNSNSSTSMMFLRNSSKHLKNIQHNLILQCFGSCETPLGGRIYFEHALVNTIAHLILEHGPNMSTRLVDKVIYQVLDGLDYLHSRERMVHNAINCDTICLDTMGVVKIAGFGLSHRVSELETTFPDKLTSYIEAGYETFWLAPEVIHQRQCSYLADVWSVGCLMAEMCTGERPMTLSEEVDKQHKPKAMRTVLELIHVVQEPHRNLLSNMVKEDAGKRLTVPILMGEFKHEVTLTRETFSSEIATGRVAANTRGFYVWSCIGPHLARRVSRNTAAERYQDS